MNQSLGQVRRRWRAALLVILLQSTAANAAPDITVEQTTRLIRTAEKGVEDPRGWALDLHDVMQLHSFPQTKENLCAAIAIIDQESGFHADPIVPGLGKLSEQALRDKFGKVPIGGALALKWLENNPTSEASFMARIRNARTERDLDLAYRALVDYAGKSASMDMVLRFGLLNKLIEEKNEIDTAGSMQVSVKFALEQARKRRWLPMTLDDVYAVRDQLYTRHGGMYYGVQQLLGYDTGYSQKLFRFADFNAGRYAARNAGLQQVIAVLSGEALAIDGDLLSYGKDGQPLNTVTASEKAVRKANLKHKLGLDDKTIRTDLLKEKSGGLTSTRTYIALRDRFAAVAKKPAPFAAMPDIKLESPKLSRKFTTRRFAESVAKRYQTCMKVK
jgi:Protein of unknown function (DUF1615)